MAQNNQSQFEAFLSEVIGLERAAALGFSQTAIIAGYQPEFLITNIDPNEDFIIESNKDVFWRRMCEKYPGENAIPRFMGRVRSNVFLPLKNDKIVHIGQ